MIRLVLTEEARADLRTADAVAVLRIAPTQGLPDRWVIRSSTSNRRAFLSDEVGITLFASIDAAVRLIQACRPDLAGAVQIDELTDDAVWSPEPSPPIRKPKPSK